MNIEFDNLKKVCCARRLEFRNSTFSSVESRCYHKDRKTYKCHEEVCPLNNKNYWKYGSDAIIIIDGKEHKIGNIKYHIENK